MGWFASRASPRRKNVAGRPGFPGNVASTRLLPGSGPRVKVVSACPVSSVVIVTLSTPETVPEPSTAVNVANTGFTFRDLIHERAQDDSLVFDMDRALAAMEENNFIYTHFNFDIFSIGFRVKPLYFSLAATEKVRFNFKYPKSLA